MTLVINAGASGFAAATVRDDSPSNEPRYRAQFLIDANNLVGLGPFSGVQIFSAQSTASYLNKRNIVALSVSGGTSMTLNIQTVNQGGSNNLSTTSTPLTAGMNRIEIDWQAGASGSLNVWVNNTTEGSPTKTLTGLNNAGWVGVNRAVLGLSGTNNLFRTNNAGQVVSFDQFDSRRSTFIGH